MNSTALGWKKQAPDPIKISNKKSHSRKKILRKIPPSKENHTVQFVEPNVPKTARTDQIFTNYQPYAPLSTVSSATNPPKRFANIIPVYNDDRLCSTRGVLVTFIITIILIAAAGTAVGITFAAINSANSSRNGNNNNQNQNQNSFSTISAAILTSSVSIGSQTGSPCSAYTTIDDPSRNYTLAGSSGSCDNGPLFNSSNGGAWIRFVGTGGTTIASSPPGVNSCGAFLPAWYNTTLPVTVGDTVNGTICIETYGDSCLSAMDVPVVYCSGNYYIYFLSPVPLCNVRYCTA